MQIMWSNMARQAKSSYADDRIMPRTRSLWEWPRQPMVLWAIPGVSEFIHLGQIMDPTHVFKWCRGGLWCQKCGGTAFKAPGMLTYPCRMTPVSNYMQRRLRGIRNGKCPVKGAKQWPQSHEVGNPYAAFLVDE